MPVGPICVRHVCGQKYDNDSKLLPRPRRTRRPCSILVNKNNMDLFGEDLDAGQEYRSLLATVLGWLWGIDDF